MVQVVRRTSVTLGPLKITREEQRYIADVSAPHTAAPRTGGFRALGFVTLLCASAGGIAMAASRTPMLSDYVVSLPVPQPVVRTSVQLDVPPPARRKRRAAPATVASAEDADADLIALDIPATRTRLAAIDAALRTGEMQEWRDATGADHGYVVAGPASDEGALACRDLSILTRAPGAADRVDQRHECRARPAG
jgi:hypothetical protein